MSREIMQQALDALEWNTAHSDDDNAKRHNAIEALRQALAQPEPTACGYDETVGLCTNNPCCEQTPVSQLWECIGRWSSYLALNGEKANLAPPEWLVAAVKAATAPPKREWVGLTVGEVIDIQNCNRGFWTNAAKIEQLLKDKNT